MGRRFGRVVALMGCLASASLPAVAPLFQGNEHWNFYGDFLYMKRSELNNKPLVVNASSTVIDSKNLLHDFNYETGYRVGAVYMPNLKYGFEGAFTYLRLWEGKKGASELGLLSFPFDNPNFSVDFTNADAANSTYKSDYWDAEVNFWNYFTKRRSEYFGLGGLIGARFFHLDENFDLQMIKGLDSSNYKIKTENRLIALQLGVDFQMHPMRALTWELLAKGGAFANNSEQTQLLRDRNNILTLRDSSSQRWQAGFFSDVSAKMGIELFKWFNIHVGYEVLYATGLSLAPEQVSRKTGTNAGKRNHTHGNIVIQGLLAGIILRI